MISWMLLAGAVSTSSTLMPCRALRLAALESMWSANRSVFRHW